MAPDPGNIPKSIWKNSVLPEMGARMGYSYNDYDPYRYQSEEERLQIRLSKKYPDEATIDSSTWWGIHDYIVALAPDSIPVDVERSDRNHDLEQFATKKIALPKLSSAIITTLQYDSVSSSFSIADARGGIYHWPRQNLEISKKFKTAVTSYYQKRNELFVTEVGVLNPSEISAGLLSRMTFGRLDTIAMALHRPVFLEIEDLNDDGKEEYIICEFGNLTGQLSLLKAGENGYDKQTIHPFPGAIKLEITDMNNDGKKDIVALFAQGNEGVFIFYQESDLRFRGEQVLRFPPEYGTSWFELIDYDGDGDKDVVLTNGDNADYSIFLKPYHGIRLFLNDGANEFNQEWFYPIYGATRVLVDDYDLDGDFDFAVSALFNDMENAPKESFVYLENKNSDSFEFKPHTLKEEFSSGWLTMAQGDYDSDGDVDIMIGSFNVKGLRSSSSLFQSKQDDPVKIIVLENQQKSNTVRELIRE